MVSRMCIVLGCVYRALTLYFRLQTHLPTPLFNAYKPILLYKWRGVSDARVAGSAKAMAEQMRLEHSAAMREQVN